MLAARWPRAARAVAVVAALLSIAAAYGVYETGHRGGALVYRHAAGVEIATTTTSVTADPAAKPQTSSRDTD